MILMYNTRFKTTRKELAGGLFVVRIQCNASENRPMKDRIYPECFQVLANDSKRVKVLVYLAYLKILHIKWLE